METARRSRIGRIVLALLAIAALMVAGAATAAAGTPAKGAASSAYGAYASVHDIHVGPLGGTHWPSGPTHGSIVDTHHDLVIIGAGETDSWGEAGSGHRGGSSGASAALATVGVDLFMLNDLLPLPSILSLSTSGVTSSCSYAGGKTSGTSSLGSADLTIVGKKTSLPLNLPKNLNLSIPGLINIVVNKQTVDSQGNLQVTPLWVESTPLWNLLTLGATISIALAPTSCGPTGAITVPGTSAM